MDPKPEYSMGEKADDMMLTQERLKELLHYDPETGKFTWQVNRGRIKVGNLSGNISSYGYRRIGIDGAQYQAHRLAFLYMENWMPEQVDHDEHDRDDNRWHKIHPSTPTKNQRNASLSKNNASGHVGVRWHKRAKKWQAEIMVDYKYIYLGLFTEKHDAEDARKAADMEYGFHENHGKAA